MSKPKILVTGGVGFIGSHTVVELYNAGYQAIIIDNLNNSEAFILDRIEQILTRLLPFIAPVFLVLYNLYTIAQQAHTTRNNDTFYAFGHRAWKWLVGTLPSMLNLTAYVFIATMGAMSPLAAALFISASLVAVVDGGLRAAQYYFTPQKPESETPLSWEENLADIRQKARENRTYETLWIKMYAALALSATVAMSFLFPLGPFVVLTFVTLFIFIPVIKNARLNRIHTESSNELLEALAQCEDEAEPTASTGAMLESQPQVDNHERRITALEQLGQPSQLGLFKPGMLDPLDDPSNAHAASLGSLRL